MEDIVGNDASVCIWLVCSDSDAGYLCLGVEERMVHPRVRLCVCIGVGVWIPPGRMAIRSRRGCLVRSCCASVVAEAGVVSQSGLGGIFDIKSTWFRSSVTDRIPRHCRSKAMTPNLGPIRVH